MVSCLSLSWTDRCRVFPLPWPGLDAVAPLAPQLRLEPLPHERGATRGDLGGRVVDPGTASFRGSSAPGGEGAGAGGGARERELVPPAGVGGLRQVDRGGPPRRRGSRGDLRRLLATRLVIQSRIETSGPSLERRRKVLTAERNSQLPGKSPSDPGVGLDRGPQDPGRGWCHRRCKRCRRCKSSPELRRRLHRRCPRAGHNSRSARSRLAGPRRRTPAGSAALRAAARSIHRSLAAPGARKSSPCKGNKSRRGRRCGASRATRHPAAWSSRGASAAPRRPGAEGSPAASGSSARSSPCSRSRWRSM